MFNQMVHIEMQDQKSLLERKRRKLVARLIKNEARQRQICCCMVVQANVEVPHATKKTTTTMQIPANHHIQSNNTSELLWTPVKDQFKLKYFKYFQKVCGKQNRKSTKNIIKIDNIYNLESLCDD